MLDIDSEGCYGTVAVAAVAGKVIHEDFDVIELAAVEQAVVAVLAVSTVVAVVVVAVVVLRQVDH